jgi:hypothetical protein
MDQVIQMILPNKIQQHSHSVLRKSRVETKQNKKRNFVLSRIIYRVY